MISPYLEEASRRAKLPIVLHVNGITRWGSVGFWIEYSRPGLNTMISADGVGAATKAYLKAVEELS